MWEDYTSDSTSNDTDTDAEDEVEIAAERWNQDSNPTLTRPLLKSGTLNGTFSPPLRIGARRD